MTTEVVPFQRAASARGPGRQAAPRVSSEKKSGAAVLRLLHGQSPEQRTRGGLTTSPPAALRDWCESRGLPRLADVKSAHVAAYIEGLAVAKPEGPGLSKPSIKHLAALRMLLAEARSKPCGYVHDAAIRPARRYRFAR